MTRSSACALLRSREVVGHQQIRLGRPPPPINDRDDNDDGGVCLKFDPVWLDQDCLLASLVLRTEARRAESTMETFVGAKPKWESFDAPAAPSRRKSSTRTEAIMESCTTV
jgi:hypothetical protein